MSDDADVGEANSSTTWVARTTDETKGERAPIDETTCTLLLGFGRVRTAAQRHTADSTRTTTTYFAGADGTVLRPDTLCRSFRRAVKRSGLPPIRFHDLRYTSASLALAAGVPM